MIKDKIKILAISGLLSLSLCACGGSKNTESGQSENVNNNAAEENNETSGNNAAMTADFVSYVTSKNTTYLLNTEGLLKTSDIFTKRDLKNAADTDGAVKVTVADSTTYEISSEGIYIFSGSAKDYTIKVNADKETKVQLVLDGVEITNSDFPAIYVQKVDKCFVTTTESENKLSVSGEFVSDGDEKTDAVIYSKSDLVLNGLGSLIVSSTDNGISGKDDLKITGGNISVKSVNDAIEANDSIMIAGGALTLSSEKDGLHCKNDKNDTLGYIYIADGSFDIDVSGDAIQANSVIQIDNGCFALDAGEGFEGTEIQINGGNISIAAQNDGFNASEKSSSYDCGIIFNDGTTKIVMNNEDNDAIDSNGFMSINGGTIDITTPGSPIDCKGIASFNGGTLIINGEEVDSIPANLSSDN